MANKNIDYKTLDLRLIEFFGRTFQPFARVSIFIVFFWFGLIKLIGLSQASPLAMALTKKTVGIEHFDQLFYILAVFECILGIMILFPKLTRIVIPLLLIHMAIVCSPLLLVPELTWQRFLVPTLEGQYIIKNAVVVAVAIGIAATTRPYSQNPSRSAKR